jgi:hypothetical protein
MSKPYLQLVTNRKQSDTSEPDQPIDWTAKLKEAVAQKRAETTLKKIEDSEDNRIKCYQCSYLASNGSCLNSKAAGAVGPYHPVPDIKRRCQGFKGGTL